MDWSRTALVVVLFSAACGGDGSPAPQSPEDRMPLPPLSASAVGYLLEHESELRLTPQQSVAFKDLERQLEAQNEALQDQLDALRPRARRGAEGAARGGQAGGRAGTGGGRGGMGGGPAGMGGGGTGGGRAGMGGGGMGGRAGGGRGGQRPAGGGQLPPAMQAEVERRRAEAQKLRDQMAANHTRILARAYCVLEPGQRQRAATILDDEGYDAPDAATSCDGPPAANAVEPGAAPDEARPAPGAVGRAAPADDARAAPGADGGPP